MTEKTNEPRSFPKISFPEAVITIEHADQKVVLQWHDGGWVLAVLDHPSGETHQFGWITTTVAAAVLHIYCHSDNNPEAVTDSYKTVGNLFENCDLKFRPIP